MARTKLKYLVPLCGLGLTAALLVAGYLQERERERVWGPISSWDGPPPLGFDLAFALSAPIGLAEMAIFRTIAFALEVFDVEPPPPWAYTLPLVLAAPLVVVQWLFVGWMAGRGRESPSAAPVKPGAFSISVNILASLASLGCLWFGIHDMKTSGWMSTWIPGAGIVAWSVIAAAVFSFRLRRAVAPR